MDKKENNDISFKKIRLIIVLVAGLVVLAFLLGIFVGASSRINDNSSIKEYKEEKKNNVKPSEEEIENETPEDKEEIENETPKDKEEIIKSTEDRTIDKQIEDFIKKIPAEYTNIKANDLTNQEKLYFAYDKLYSHYYGKNIPEEAIEIALKELFGNDVTYQNEDIHALDLPEEVFARYNADGKFYTDTESNGRGTCNKVDKYWEIISNDNKDNEITVSTKVVYKKGCTGTGPLRDIYKDKDLKEKINVAEKYCDREMSTDYCAIKTEEFFKENADSLNTLVYVFRIKDKIVTFVELKSH